MSAKKIIFQVLVCIEEDDGGYHAFCPNLKGLHTSGRTQKEALENAQHAADAYIRSLMAHHDPIPLTVVIEDDCEDKAPSARPFSSLVEVPI